MSTRPSVMGPVMSSLSEAARVVHPSLRLPKNAGRCPKNDIPAGRPCWRSRCQKLGTDRPFVQNLVVESGCRMSQRRDDFLLIALATGSAMAVRLSLPRKKAPNPIDQHVGSRLRMRRLMLAMSQEKLAAALGLTFQQVQKYERGANRIGASRLQQMSHILQVPVGFFSEGAPNEPPPPASMEARYRWPRLMTSSPI